ncbi:hypothetical protein [Dasania marina]|uniref:hypothetical protein n=1 Tax=Dasania marina TaxID=471499 RepID=UPI0030DD40EE|tara:strand:+ start:10182 stop:10490 length:309 start_codon:yes stop_codon:yes gene_type:complete
MNKTIRNAAILLSGLLCVSAASAHDPSQHAAKAEKPNCEAMGSKHGKMDANDPVMLAMMKQCQQQASTEGHGDNHQPQAAEGGDEHSGHKTAEPEGSASHNH